MFHTDLKSVFGDGLLVVRGDEWREQRNRMRAVFTKRRLDALVLAFQPVIEEHVVRWVDEAKRSARRHRYEFDYQAREAVV